MTKLSAVWSRLKGVSRSVFGRPALLASLAVTGLLVGGRQLSLTVLQSDPLESWELSAYDRMLQLRPALPPDSRLLVVKVTEADIQAQGEWPVSDAVIDRLLKNLQVHEPAVIGLDIYRDFAQPPGEEALAQRLQTSDRIIPACQLSDEENPSIPPPPGVPESRAGFSDIPLDRPNGTVRRGLLFVGPDPATTTGCTTPFSLSFQLARSYLQQQGIEPRLTPQEHLRFGDVVFKPLSPNSGGYRGLDSGGYQILLNYRSPDNLAPSLTLTEVLKNQFDPNLVKNRIVLIGVTAPSEKDTFVTPYSSFQKRLEKMPGVEIHGHIVSQLLSAVLDGRSQFWFWPAWGEILWLWSWSLTGGFIVRITRNPTQLVLGESLALSVLVGSSVALFFASGWVPVAAPMLGAIATGTIVLAYSAYKAERERIAAEKERLYIEQKVREREENIALLQNLLKEKEYNPPTTHKETAIAEQAAIPFGESTQEFTEELEESEADEDEGDTYIWSPEDAVSREASARTNSQRTSLLGGRYRINRVLGSGGFGYTYLAEDTHRPGSPQCVVKRLSPARQDERFLQVARRLFRTEAEILEKLSSHLQVPHPIPQLLAYFEDKKEFYLVQEYIQGEPLSEELPVDKRLPEEQVIALLKGVLEILTFVHKHSVVHRDIKPSNIMRRQQDSQFVLIDFGAVKQIQPQENSDRTISIGTPGYAPPEQYTGHPSFSSDIYALGMIAIQALTGIPPNKLELSEETGQVNWRHLANVREDLAQLVDKMVRYHFVDRYQSAELVLQDLVKLE
jgi:CHASE2 domain-containing sensor protein/tRNA A-37 threonylcarbamoyl transferase component Bud32